MHIRKETATDYKAVYSVVKRAFESAEHADGNEQDLVNALRKGDFDTFLALITESGLSSWRMLQNVVPAGYTHHQEVAVALALCERLLGGRGACRVHGGGFAGTIQAFVPLDMLPAFVSGMEAVAGQGACHVLSFRGAGSVPLVC